MGDSGDLVQEKAGMRPSPKQITTACESQALETLRGVQGWVVIPQRRRCFRETIWKWIRLQRGPREANSEAAAGTQAQTETIPMCTVVWTGAAV